jgi:HPt (histidine-containing phosphotransfer) domain-containing protein
MAIVDRVFQRRSSSDDRSMTPVQEDPDVVPAAVERLRHWGGNALVREMSAIFFEDAPTRLAAARAGVSDGDPAAVVRAMHALKASAGQLGAVRAQRLCNLAEQQARAGDLAGLGTSIDEIAEALNRFHTWLVTTAPAD